jgi:hypothetical protein
MFIAAPEHMLEGPEMEILGNVQVRIDFVTPVPPTIAVSVPGVPV